MQICKSQLQSTVNLPARNGICNIPNHMLFWGSLPSMYFLIGGVAIKFILLVGLKDYKMMKKKSTTVCRL